VKLIKVKKLKKKSSKERLYHKTKEVLTTDEAISARQAPFIAVARPLATALDILEHPEYDNEDCAERDVMKALDALILLGNANIRLNNWRQKRFSEFLTEVGKRTLKEDTYR
jgi:hypothetical protein